MTDSLDINRRSWDERAPAHAASPDYDLERLVADPAALSDAVAFDRPRLGDIRGRRGVHLQCHIGTDTISLARLGARMTGLDFSPVALEQARELAARTDLPIDWVQADVARALDVLPAAGFDLVYTGNGALCWLPSVAEWARVVAGLLAPGGRLFMREFHPMLWSVDYPREDGLLVIDYPYFERSEPLVFDEPGTYVQTDATFTQTVTHEWNHGLGEIITALLDAGLELTMLTEHDSAPNEMMPGQMVSAGGGEWRLARDPDRLPLSYTLQAVRRATDGAP